MGEQKRELALFAGAGGGILGGFLLGWRTVCAVEIDDYCRKVLLARQREGHLARFPIWDDVRTFDGWAWRGKVDIISGGFPCQDISSARAGDGEGITGKRSGLWKEFARIIEEVRPKEVFIENSNHLRTKGLVTVLQDLASLGYDASWGVLGATAIGAPHLRKRMWIVATDANLPGQREQQQQHAEVAGAQALGSPNEPVAANPNGLLLRVHAGRGQGESRQKTLQYRPASWWPVDVISGVDDGVAHRVDRTRATGNGQVSGVAALAYTALASRQFNAALDKR